MRTGGEGSGGNKVKGAKESNGRIQELDAVRPGDVFFGVRPVARPEENLVPKKDGTGGRVSEITMPLAPPAGASVAQVFVIRVTAEKNRQCRCRWCDRQWRQV